MRLRLTDDGAEVGEVAIGIRGRTVEADGAARIRASRISRTGRTATRA